MRNYADYCPIASGVDVLGDRWVPLIIRELMIGCHRFNEIHRGVPRMSRTLLARRLRQMERMGLITSETATPGRPGRYELTEAGQALTPIVWAIGQWAAEWIFQDPTEEECDGISLIWRMHQHVVPEKLPRGRTIVHVVLTGPGGAEGWLQLERDAVSVCKDDQGHDVDMAIEADTAQMQRWICGRVSFRELLSSREVRLLGPTKLTRAFDSWFDVSGFAEGNERGEQRQHLRSMRQAVS